MEAHQNQSDSSFELNIQETIEDHLDQAKCKQGNQCVMLCTSAECESQAAVCEDSRCSCRKKHNKNGLCLLAEFLPIVKRTQQKRQRAPELLKWIEHKYDQLVDFISRQRDKILNKVKYFGLGKREAQFLAAVRTGKCYNLTGSKIHEAVKDLNTETKSFKNLQSTIDQNLKKKWQISLQNILRNIEKINEILADPQKWVTCDIDLDSKVMESQTEKLTLTEMLKSSEKKVLGYELLYRASAHDFKVKKFWKQCNNTVIPTEFDKVIGGYTPLSWKIEKDGIYQEDSSLRSFVFSVTDNIKLNLKESQKQCAICHDKKSGPIFGGGCDISVSNKANFNDSKANVCSSYDNSKIEFQGKEKWQLFQGSKKLKVQDQRMGGVASFVQKMNAIFVYILIRNLPLKNLSTTYSIKQSLIRHPIKSELQVIIVNKLKIFSSKFLLLKNMKLKQATPRTFLIFAIICSTVICIEKLQQVNLLEGWTVDISKCPGNNLADTSLETSIPTNIHLDLLYNGKIEDPFFGSKWESMKWLSECHATYSKNITISEQQLKFAAIDIIFEGIDTYSTVKLNSVEILKTNNAFVEYKARIKSLLKAGANLLEVEIESTKSYDDRGQSSNHMPFPYAHTRKACYQYSWDWAPYMNTLGIWKEARLEMYDEMKLDYVWVRLAELSEQKAKLNFALKLKTIASKNIQFSKYKAQIHIKGSSSVKEFEILDHESYGLLEIENPKLWWPNGIGQPHIYDFTVKLLHQGRLIDSKQIPYGIKTVQLDQKNNKFTVIVNGYKIYCKGANYVPPDMLYSRLNNPKYGQSGKIQQLLVDARDSNFNMIRLWGGGQYESNEFYELASRMGLMVFYDFMFSDSIYPSTDDFLRNVQREVVEQIRRVRNYPCLMLWSGNNEILQGVQSWGWGSSKYKEDYKKLFETHIPKIILNESPSIPYIPSSPVNGVGNGGFQRGGDIHYWGVWAGGSGFETYETAIGPFNSEFGTQSLPVWETIQQFTDSQGRSYESAQLLSHERHNSKFSTLRRYMGIYAKQSLNFELEAYQSGLVQAFGIEIAIKGQRASKPSKSWGTLYWQFNDAWPAISWSSIDYYGRWKPLQYMAKRLYPNVIAYYHHYTGKVLAINDNLYRVNCYVNVKVMSFQGEIYQQWNDTFWLDENEMKQVRTLTAQKLELQANGTKTVIVTKIIYGNLPHEFGLLTTFIEPFKKLQLPKCALNVELDFKDNSISLSAKCLLKSVHIYSSKEYVALEDNYIDVVPGEVHRTVVKEISLRDVKDSLKFRSYRQVYEAGELEVEVTEKN